MAKARILAVDDQRYFRELIAGMLSEEGFDAQTAASAEEALHVLDNADFDVVLTDLVMPGMDGSELVQRIKERDPEQEPFDRRTLAVTLEAILQNRRLRAEHGRLLAENIEYIGERSLYERALGLFSTLAIEPLSMRIADALCLETRAQGAVLWIAGESGPDMLDLSAARGLVRLADEPETVEIEELPAELRAGARTALAPWGDGASPQPALYATLRRDGRIAGLVRLTDKLEGEAFDVVDIACVDKLLHFADTAVANALKMRSLERRGLKDPSTGAYHFDYFRDVVRNEIEKASRFGRSLALLKLDFGTLRELRRVGADDTLHDWLGGVAGHLARLLRATDLLAVDDAYRFYMLLPEANGLGAAVLKRRALAALEGSELFTRLDPKRRPSILAGGAIYPGDGTLVESLLAALDARIVEQRTSPVAALGLSRLSLPAALQALARRGTPERPETAAQLARFILSEVGRRPRERGLLYTAPGNALSAAVHTGLEALRDVPVRTDLVVIADGERPAFSVPGVNWISPRRVPGLPPCLVHYGDGPAYAVVREEAHNGSTARMFHTSDRSLVEHLAFRLQEELCVPASLGLEEAR
jgi:CheY-like chemotaxis protein/GGDEF domain-containing protein